MSKRWNGTVITSRCLTAAHPRMWLLLLAAIFALAQPSMGQTPNCLLDKAGLDSAPCTANDDMLIGFSILGEPIECAEGQSVEVVIRAVAQSTASERYDPGVFIALDGGDAKHGSCQEGFFPPPLTTCSIADFNDGLCEDPYDPADGRPPYLNLEPEILDDTCGDQEQGIPTAVDIAVTVTCTDPDGNGQLELGTCLSWDNQGGDQGNTCNAVNGPVLGTGSKCRCEELTVAGITVNPDPCAGVNCDDGIACTDDACDASTGECRHAPNDANCDDGVGCTSDLCDPTVGCLFTPSDAACDDGLFCNGTEICDPGSDCQSGSPIVCDDGVGCTDDSCDEETDTCAHNANDGNCDDGLFCNGPEVCDPGNDCQSGSPIVCDDGVGCTDDACDEDGDACAYTVNDGNCDDGVGCTDDRCDPIADCQTTPNDARCDDDVFCTDDLCDPIADCQSSPNDANCDDGVFCTDDRCDPVADCQSTPNDANCDDGRLCTDEACAPEEPGATLGGCLFTFDPENDPTCELEICRTAGFWGTHSLLVQKLFDLGFSGFMVCGATVDNILPGSERSSVEALCVRPRGDLALISARMLTAASLSCILTAGDPYCVGTGAEELWSALDEACVDGDRERMSDLESRLACWLEGGDLALYESIGRCVTGSCLGIPGADHYCEKDKDCADCPEKGCCVPFADSCHEQPLVNTDLGFDFEPAGQWVDSTSCRQANRTDCTLPYLGDCEGLRKRGKPGLGRKRGAR